MFSYEKRLETFYTRNWPTSGYQSTPHLMAICGFVCKSTKKELSAVCVYCKKHLEGWESTDVPFLEHYSHKKDCILFSPEKLAVSSNLNFIRYDLKTEVPFIFCYKCGSTDETHTCPIEVQFSLDLQTPSDFFFIRLISGQYENLVNLYVAKTLSLPNDYKNLFTCMLADKTLDLGSFKTVRECINDYIDKEIEKIELIIETDIQKYINKY